LIASGLRGRLRRGYTPSATEYKKAARQAAQQVVWTRLSEGFKAVPADEADEWKAHQAERGKLTAELIREYYAAGLDRVGGADRRVDVRRHARFPPPDDDRLHRPAPGRRCGFRRGARQRACPLARPVGH
jgi:hypothetical protein